MNFCTRDRVVSLWWDQRLIVLGGFGNLSALDIVESEEFLLKCFKVNKRSKKKMPDSASLGPYPS